MSLNRFLHHAAVILFLVCVILAVLTSCSPGKRCPIRYVMPDGAVCREVQSWNFIPHYFTECSSGKEYLDPPSFERVERCQP